MEIYTCIFVSFLAGNRKHWGQDVIDPQKPVICSPLHYEEIIKPNLVQDS